METHPKKPSEVIIPVLEHVKLHFGTCRISVWKIIIKIAMRQPALRDTGASCNIIH